MKYLQIIVMPMLAFCYINLSGCILYRPDITQGTLISEEMLVQISTGTSKQDVLRVLGGNNVVDPFYPQQWNYIYLKKTSDTQYQKQVLRLTFDPQNNVTHIGTSGEFLKEDRNAITEPR